MSSDNATLHAAPESEERWRARFFTLWSGQACSLFGSQLVQFALIWYLTQAIGSATTLAIASLIGLLPQVLLSPLIGTLVDRWNRRAVMIAADCAVALATLALALLFALNTVQLWHIYALLFVRAVGGGFHSSAFGASVVLLVPREHLGRVQGFNHALRGGLEIASAPVGALLLAWLPMQSILAIDLATAALAITPLLFFGIPQPVRNASATRPSLSSDLRAGLRYVLAWPGLLIILAMAALINLVLTPTVALLPLLVTRNLSGAAQQLAWLQAASGAGVVAGGLLLGTWGGSGRRVVAAMLGLIGQGVCTIVLGATPAGLLWLALLAALLSGCMVPITNGSLGAAIQAVVAPEMQGRVFALILSLASAMAPLGLLVAGPLADTLGVRLWFWLGGGVCAAMGVVGLLTPAVLNFER